VSAPTAAVLDALERHWSNLNCLVCTYHEATPGRLYTFCPRCDSYPERALTIEPNGAGAALFCKGGCGQSDILDALGVSPSDNRATVQPVAADPPIDADAAWRQCESIAREPRVLERLTADLGRCGLVGEDRAGQLLFLATTSRLLERPISVVVKGPSSGGKSFTVETVLAFFPERACYVLTGGSPKSLAYSEEPLEHRMLVIYESAGIAGDTASYLIRTLLSEGCLRWETVESTKDGLRPKLLEREGPHRPDRYDHRCPPASRERDQTPLDPGHGHAGSNPAGDARARK
jgi:hypothetical protein